MRLRFMPLLLAKGNESRWRVKTPAGEAPLHLAQGHTRSLGLMEG